MNMELIRRFIRGCLGYRSPAYRLMACLLVQYQILRCEGCRTAYKLEKIRRSTGPEVEVSLNRLLYPLIIRPGTDDVSAVVNNAIREEYGRFDNDFAPKVIIDAGAYIGDTSAYFLSKFLTSSVIALEPNQDSFLLAQKNLMPYGDRVFLLEAALWNELTTVFFGGAEMGASIGLQGIEVSTETIASLMTKYRLDFIDLLKIDIEGAELQVIPSGVGSWLNNIGMILLETHGIEIEESLVNILTDAGFKCSRYRNVWYCKNRLYYQC
ncbi:FkbM family methyltransferase [Methylococcus mesophilus]|uniref:FkbM family methyltransferase n=1 Tax=Methylococcus mesophilus TaxID=2993564 RepID=UPI00224AEEDD|nr:FkbM family methyltransferase [Methylococcus mesophilus]UZR28734.1 FkbM family methyltransferase [Methylococcus mesophilus]